MVGINIPLQLALSALFFYLLALSTLSALLFHIDTTTYVDIIVAGISSLMVQTILLAAQPLSMYKKKKEWTDDESYSEVEDVL